MGIIANVRASPYRPLLILWSSIAGILLTLSFFGVPLVNSISLLHMQVTVQENMLPVDLGVLGFCNGDDLDQCSDPGLPHDFVDDALQMRSRLPEINPDVQAMETAISGLLTGWLVFYFFAGPLSLITLIHDAFRAAPLMTTKISYALSCGTCLLCLPPFIATYMVSHSLGWRGAVEAVAWLGSGTKMTLAASFFHYLAVITKIRYGKAVTRNAAHQMKMVV